MNGRTYHDIQHEIERISDDPSLEISAAMAAAYMAACAYTLSRWNDGIVSALLRGETPPPEYGRFMAAYRARRFRDMRKADKRDLERAHNRRIR